jgi:hypothetical protein
MLAVGGNIMIDQNSALKWTDGAKIDSSGGYTRLYTAASARPIMVGGLVVSDSYSTGSPANGAYIKGLVGIGTTTPNASLNIYNAITGYAPTTTLAIGVPTAATRIGSLIQHIDSGYGALNNVGWWVHDLQRSGSGYSSIGGIISRITSNGYGAGLHIEGVTGEASPSGAIVEGAYIGQVYNNNAGPAYGLRIENIGIGNIGTAARKTAGLRIENSITNATSSNAYAIESLSTAQSTFAGGVAVTGLLTPSGGIATGGAAVNTNGGTVQTRYITSGSYTAPVSIGSYAYPVANTSTSTYFGPSYQNTSLNVTAIEMAPTYNNSGTGANTDLLINRTETAISSGAQKILDLKRNGTTVFSVSNVGTTTISSGASYVGQAVCYLANGDLGHQTLAQLTAGTCVPN